MQSCAVMTSVWCSTSDGSARACAGCVYLLSLCPVAHAGYTSKPSLLPASITTVVCLLSRHTGDKQAEKQAVKGGQSVTGAEQQHCHKVAPHHAMEARSKLNCWFLRVMAFMFRSLPQAIRVPCISVPCGHRLQDQVPRGIAGH